MVFELDVQAELVVRLVDGGVPLAGLFTVIKAEHVEQILTSRLSNAEGLARFGPMPEGRYRASVPAPSVWPIERIVEARADGASPTVIEVRRRADLRVALTGSGRAGRRVRLQSVSHDGDPEAWLRDGLIVASPAGMETDGDGNLRVGGLPHGKYRWAVELASGDVLSGEVTLPPAGVEELRVVVP